MTYVSVLELFRVGLGPSSSHTCGPMRASRLFAEGLEAAGLAPRVDSVTCVLYGSLAATGEGHGTPAAIAAGLAGALPETVSPEFVAGVWDSCASEPLLMSGDRPVAFRRGAIRHDRGTVRPRHPNALRFEALDASGAVLDSREYFSVGGGFVEEAGAEPSPGRRNTGPPVPFPHRSAAELLELTKHHHLSVAELSRANEVAIHGEAALSEALNGIAAVMNDCVDAGIAASGILSGGLGVPRRAGGLARRLAERETGTVPCPPSGDAALGHVADVGDRRAEWLQVYAIAVGEQNAAGQRVVTAPTNGAAGTVPAVMRFARDGAPDASRRLEQDFLLVAGAIGALYKTNASISGAEAGCQGEIGSAASMAAAGLAQIWGGSPAQVENAAEIAMEHNLGLTCDPVAGLVQLPCIERNAVASGIAVAAARLALAGDGRHRISLDAVIETMRQTGRDMSSRYKETSLGGLAVNVVDC